MKPKDVNDDAWELFDEWRKTHDPDGELTIHEAIEKYAKDDKWHAKKWNTYRRQSMRGGTEWDHPAAGVQTQLRIEATEESVADLTNLVSKMMKQPTKINVGDNLNLAYKVNLSLDGFIPTDKPQMLVLLEYLDKHPHSLGIDEGAKEALLQHLEKSLQQAEMWHSLVSQVTRLFTKVFMQQEIARKKASSNEVKIE